MIRCGSTDETNSYPVGGFVWSLLITHEYGAVTLEYNL